MFAYVKPNYVPLRSVTFCVNRRFLRMRALRALQLGVCVGATL